MSKKTIKPVVPGAKPPASPKKPTAAQLITLKLDAIAQTEFNVTFADQAEFDALEVEVQDKLIAMYHRFKAAPPDPSKEQIQEGADKVIDVKLDIAKGHGPNVRAHDIDATKLTAPVMSQDGWVCPAPKKA